MTCHRRFVAEMIAAETGQPIVHLHARRQLIYSPRRSPAWIVASASALPAQPMILTHLSGSRSL